MQVFKDYVELLVEFKIEKNKLSATLGDNTKLRLFYEGIVNKTFSTEDEAATVLYGTGVTASDERFRRLKSDFKKKLQQLLLMIDFYQQEGFNEYQKAGYGNFKNIAVFKILKNRGIRAATVDLARIIFDESLQNGLSEPLFTSADYLRYYYTRVEINEKKKNFFTAAYTKSFDAFYAEKKAEFFLDEFNQYYIKTKSTKKWLEPKIIEYCTILDGYATVNSPIFILNSGLLHINRHLVVNNYRAALPECNKYLAQLEALPTLYKGGMASILQSKLVCCLMLKRYDEAVVVGLKSRELAIKGQHNWYNNSILMMQVYIRQKALNKAWAIYSEAVQNSHFSTQKEANKETIKLYGAYLTWFIVNKALKVSKEDSEKAEIFRVSRFVNDLLVILQDKSSMNIPVLLLQILFLFSEKRYDTISERLEAIRKYQTRYAGGEENLRLKNLLRLLDIADKSGYVYKTIEKNPKTAEYHEYLINTVEDIEEPTHETEMITYEDYWVFAMRCLRGEKIV